MPVNNSPFYPREVYEQLLHIVSLLEANGGSVGGGSVPVIESISAYSIDELTLAGSFVRFPTYASKYCVVFNSTDDIIKVKPFGSSVEIEIFPTGSLSLPIIANTNEWSANGTGIIKILSIRVT